MTSDAPRRRGTITARFLHVRTGHEHHETVAVHTITQGKFEAMARAEAWKRVSELARDLGPLGYIIRWS